MTVTIQDIRGMSREALSTYVWRRLRREQPLDPPLADRHRMEAPEEILIHALRDFDDADFAMQLENAIRDMLDKLAVSPVSGVGISPGHDEALASIAFLARSTKRRSLASALYQFVVPSFGRRGQPLSFSVHAVYHLLHAAADLQKGQLLVPFWMEVIDSPRPSHRAIGYYGLMRADPSMFNSSFLAKAAQDDDIDLGTFVWSYVREGPGAADLGKAASALSLGIQNTLRHALVAVGTDEHTIKQYEKHAHQRERCTGFDFRDVPPPLDEAEAGKKPQLEAAD